MTDKKTAIPREKIEARLAQLEQELFDGNAAIINLTKQLEETGKATLRIQGAIRILREFVPSSSESETPTAKTE